ncbi:TIR domain-containing protein [Nocardia asteroides]|nr:TIR domain-containing protein [Nocardia asteroides]
MNFSPVPHTGPSSALHIVFDAVHGTIDARDAAASTHAPVIPRALISTPVQRLRRIKQLDFASQAYPAADHSRFAHALGTMHVMRKLVTKLYDMGHLGEAELPLLRGSYPSCFHGDDEADRAQLLQHMLLAGLLQDLGELPFAQVTRHICGPRFALRQEISHKTGIPVEAIKPKDVFTLACIYSESLVQSIQGIDLDFLAFLITGLPSTRSNEKLAPLRQMVDGTLDADRLDYVFRDAHHTIGTTGTVDAVIDTLNYYDASGPVMTDASPISNFLVTRARLYSTVYLSPANRFRLNVLLTALRGIRDDKGCAEQIFGSNGNELSLDDFLELDEVSLTSRLHHLARSADSRRLDDRSRSALEIFAGKFHEYNHFWIFPSSNGISTATEDFSLPSELFFDTFSDQQRPIYHAGAVRIKNDSLRFAAGPVPLEQCAGPFTAMFQSPTSTLPMKDCILVFEPDVKHGRAWAQFTKALGEQRLYQVLMANDPLTTVDFPTDTRDLPGFSGPAIFISFAGADLAIVRRIASELQRRNRRYFFYAGRFQGVGDTAYHNSAQGVQVADAVMILASTNYIARYNQEPDGYISTEVFAISNRLAAGSLPFVILSADSWKEIEGGLPWRAAFKLDEAPFVGRPLRSAPRDEVAESVDEMLRAIDHEVEASSETKQQ